MVEKPIPFRDFAVAQVQGRERESALLEPSYAKILDTGWSQLQEAPKQGLSQEETGQLVHAHEDALTLYWLNQMTRDGFFQKQGYRDKWRLENDEEIVEIWFAGERGGAPSGYSAIYFAREIEGERARAQFYYKHDPSKGLLLYATNVNEGPRENPLLSHDLTIQRETPGEGMAQYTFIRRYQTPPLYAEMVWTEGTPSLETH